MAGCSLEPQRFHRFLQPFPIVFPIDPWIVHEEFNFICRGRHDSRDGGGRAAPGAAAEDAGSDHGRAAIEYSTDEFQADDVAVKAQRLFQVTHIKNDMSQGGHWFILCLLTTLVGRINHHTDGAMPKIP